MSAKHWAFVYLATLVVFLALDGGWLTFMGPVLYRPVLAPLLADTVAIVPAVVFYLLYTAGLVVLCVRPNFRSGTIASAVMTAATVGLVAYGTYDLTNHATLKVWSTALTILDMVWGMVVSSIAIAVGFWVSQKLINQDRSF